MWYNGDMKQNIAVIIIFIAVFGLGTIFPSFVRAQDIVDGDLIKVPDHADVFIAKIVGNKKFKRLILNPDIFNQYGHLKWKNVKTIDKAIVNQFTTSNIVRWVGDAKVFMLSPNIDVGTKHWLNMEPSVFEVAGYDWDSIYLINENEYKSYTTGNEIMATKEMFAARKFSYGIVADINSTGDILKLVDLKTDIVRIRSGALSFAKQDLKNYGVDILVLQVDSKPSNMDSVPPPDDFDSWTNNLYATVLANPDIKYWQIWNEPNETLYWYPEPNAKNYVELLKKSYVAVKRANPQAKVVAAGLSGINPLLRQFLRDLYSSGAREYFDILALHPYNQPNLPETYLKDFLYEIKNIMEANNDLGKPIWITEIGWPTLSGQFGAVSTETQAECLRQTYEITRNLNFIEKVFWYSLQDVKEGMGIMGEPAESAYKNLKSS